VADFDFGVDQPLAYVVEVGAGGDGDAVVVDRTPCSGSAAFSDDGLFGLFGDVERAPTEIEDDHAGMVFGCCHLEGDLGVKDVLVEGDDAAALSKWDTWESVQESFILTDE
jgi:hypothetical protein